MRSFSEVEPTVIRRFYVHNFRCLENFELPISGQSSVLLIGNNGSGKSTVGFALEILQKIARGTSRVDDLVQPNDLARGRSDVPLRLEIEVELNGDIYEYGIAFELPNGWKRLRVLEENLKVGGQPAYTRALAQVNLEKPASKFGVDWHQVALPIVQESSQGPLSIFKRWLARVLILRPIPALISGDSDQETLEPNPQVTNLGAWFSGLLADAPAGYSRIERYLREVMPDFQDIKNPIVAKDSRTLSIQFSSKQGDLSLPLRDLSDGEKCYLICAMVLASSDAYRPSICFWDEPDNYLALSEVGHFIIALRKAFQERAGQLIATSHNPEAIRRFSRENTMLLQRRSHLEPTTIRPLSELQADGDLVGALIRGDLEP